MKVLITGATGCLGGALARRLVADGASVTATGRNRAAGDRLAEAGARFEAAELTNGAAIDGLVAAQEVVVHCGGLSSAWGRQADFDAANVTGTDHVVQACRRRGVKRLIFISTPSLYFDFMDRLNLSEDAALARRPVNAYAASKLAAERIVVAAAGQGLDTVIVRPRAIFGSGDSSLIPRLLRVAAKGRLPLIDGGRAVIDLTYVDNVVDALVALAGAGSHVAGRIYNISNGEPHTVEEVFRWIVALWKLNVRLTEVPYRLALAAATVMEMAAWVRPRRPEPILTRYSVGVLGKSQTLSIAAARRDFGYEPRVSIAEGLQRAAKTWRAEHG